MNMFKRVFRWLFLDELPTTSTSMALVPLHPRPLTAEVLWQAVKDQPMGKHRKHLEDLTRFLNEEMNPNEQLRCTPDSNRSHAVISSDTEIIAHLTVKEWKTNTPIWVLVSTNRHPKQWTAWVQLAFLNPRTVVVSFEPLRAPRVRLSSKKV